MNAEMKSKWVAGLLSGRYPQGRYALKTGDGCYCAMGVAVEACGIGQFEVDPTEAELLYGIPAIFPDLSRRPDRLSPVALEALGITPVQEAAIIHMSDAEGMTFAEIAAEVMKL